MENLATPRAPVVTTIPSSSLPIIRDPDLVSPRAKHGDTPESFDVTALASLFGAGHP